MSADPTRRLATALRRARLDVPARLLADAHRPISPLLADLGAAVGPLLGAAGAPTAQRMLADPAMLDRVIAELDAAEEARAGAD